MPDSNLTAQIILLVVLILINAFFAAAEMSVVSVNKNKMKTLSQQGNKRADAVLKQLDEPNKFLSTIQVAITLAGFMASAVAAVSLSDDLGALAQVHLGWDAVLATDIAVVVVTILLSYVTLVLGELFPKRVAMQHAEGIAMITIGPVKVVGAIAKPFVWFLSVSVNILLRLTRQKVNVDNDEFSEDEVKSMLEAGQESGVLKEEGRKMINSIFEFDDKLAYEIMTPRTDVFAIDINDPVTDFLDELMEMRYSRIPVIDEDFDNVIGILNIKDYLIQAREHGFDNVDISSIIRKAHFVPETKNIDTLFFEMQKLKQHIVMLIDEYGGFSGIVTMEDIIEEVMGEIDDEFDEEETQYEKIDDNTYMISGSMDLDDLNEAIGTNLASEDSETIAGLVVDMLGEIPDEDEQEERIVEYENYVFKIESVKDRRIEKVKLCIQPENIAENGEKSVEEDK